MTSEDFLLFVGVYIMSYHSCLIHDFMEQIRIWNGDRNWHAGGVWQ
jgi:hypothetical protein